MLLAGLLSDILGICVRFSYIIWGSCPIYWPLCLSLWAFVEAGEKKSPYPLYFLYSAKISAFWLVFASVPRHACNSNILFGSQVLSSGSFCIVFHFARLTHLHLPLRTQLYLSSLPSQTFTSVVVNEHFSFLLFLVHERTTAKISSDGDTW